MINKFKRTDIKNLKPYIVNEIKYDVVLDANESFIKYEDFIQEEIFKEIKKVDLNRYPDNNYKDLKKICASYLDVDPDNIVCTNGSDEAISLLTTAFLSPEDTLLWFNPDFAMYQIYTCLRGAKHQILNSNEDFSINIDYVIEKVKQIKPNILIFSNPTNPSGYLMSIDDIKKILDNCDTLVVVDEAYIEFANTESVCNLIIDYENLIVLRTCSKALGLANIRLGFLISNAKIIYEINKVRVPYNLNGVTAKIAEVILSHNDVIKFNVETIINNREKMLSKLTGIKGLELIPTSANFFLMKFEDCDYVYNKLLERSIKLRKFSSDRLKDYLRVCVGTKEENNIFINAIKEIMEAQ
jgi:histidinol-phosphate aminotransferase